ncbi:MAG: hypothetical protein PHH71_00925 [Clostridia bacterium]|jgi:hypothetical protein|nr:hypothetical protein [Clostridia bacterium]MDD3231741.1 hypothetical protein [Clostridia bacterium]MDD3862317.1 hypothetical protein [Clostridia bacterium]MDD4408231.1 hypothetical protein [Clostridia bacterium]
MACGDIVNVEIKENNFIIITDEQILYDTLTDNSNPQLIKQALNLQGFDGEIIINRTLKQNELVAQDIEKLKNFGLNVKIFQ